MITPNITSDELRRIASKIDNSKRPDKSAVLIDLWRLAASMGVAKAQNLTKKLFEPLRELHEFLEENARKGSVIESAAKTFVDMEDAVAELDKIVKYLKGVEGSEDVNVSADTIFKYIKLGNEIRDIIKKGTAIGKDVLKYFGNDEHAMMKRYDEMSKEYPVPEFGVTVDQLVNALNFDEKEKEILEGFYSNRSNWEDLSLLGRGNIEKIFERKGFDPTTPRFEKILQSLKEGAEALKEMASEEPESEKPES